MLPMNTALSGMVNLQDLSFIQTYRLKQGINKFKEKGITAAHKDM